ncbi:hypothetical protein MUB24_01810 [Lederbergia sp. NSJ-179]|uniref:hypothetical protein n=1 Tax=Lederbergia sp. NSJ-179 TaxID=2931402 RepID=UPI001FD1E72E|nr:hypothetical protein [Lederbergia sp. NSJ-179]MCJ7839665.1 hypothetical protein [Lederbergia sp. NSJ-179]
MSLKSIELQVALPRTMEAGKITEQLQQRGQNMSEQVSEEIEEKLKRDRESVNHLEEKVELQLREEDGSSQQNHPQQPHTNRRNKSTEKKNRDNHPYKGNRIDYSG